MKDVIIRLDAIDIRFPTSESLDGSDAINKDPDYSAAYIVIETESGAFGHGLIFTIGRGNDICCQAVESMRHLVIGQCFDAIKDDILSFYNHLKGDSQLRWLGPEKGVIHMAMGGVMNAVWDMWARQEAKPVWQLVADMSPEQLVDCLDFQYVSDALDKTEALEILKRLEATKGDRLAELKQHGYPAYTTSAGWLGYSDEKIIRRCKEAIDQGFNYVKLKVGQSLTDDVRRCQLVRDTLGNDVRLMIDANQVWEVDDAIAWVNTLTPFAPWFIEEPTSPDDVAGHKSIKRALDGVTKVATGEHCQNRILFKQFIAEDAIDIVQIDACRLASINEILVIYLLAAKYNKPVCPHAGGVGLCEYVQHLSIIDYLCISGSLEDRVIEFVDHLHEHFEDPCVITNGAYQLPNKPGFSVKMHAASLGAYEYPNGSEWQKRRDKSQSKYDLKSQLVASVGS